MHVQSSALPSLAFSSASFRLRSSSLLVHLNFARYTASSWFVSVIVCLQKRFIFGFFTNTSATRMLNELAFCSIGLFSTLMSLSFSFLNSRSSTSKLAILFPLRLRYSNYSRGGSSSSIFSILFLRRCSFLTAGIVSQPDRALTKLFPI